MGWLALDNNPEIENMAERLETNDISIQAGKYFDVLVLLQFSCLRKYVGLDLVQTGSLGFFFLSLMDLIYCSVKSLISGLGQREDTFAK